MVKPYRLREMDKTLNYIKKNFFGVACLLYVIEYLIFQFNTWASAILFLFVLVFLYFSLFFFTDFFRGIIYAKSPVPVVLKQNGLEISLLVCAGIIIYLLAGWRLLNALLLGILIIAVFIALLFLFKKKPHG